MIEHSALKIPHGIADPEENVAYVVGPEGFITCLALESGKSLGRTDFPASPLTIYGGMLIGWRPAPDQPNAVRLFAAARKGKGLHLKWKEALELPGWVEVGSLEPGQFTLGATIEGKRVVATWEAHSRYRGGAPPPAQVEDAASHDERRTVRLDPETGAAVEQERAEPAPSLEEQVLPEMPPTMRIVPYRSGTSWVTRSWRVGSADAFLARTAKEPGIVLVRRDPAGAARGSEIRLTDDPAAEAAVTPDGRMIFVHEPGGDAPAWHVFSAETGDRITRLPFDPGTEGVAVVNDQVLYEVVEDRGGTRRRTLRSRNLQTGEAMWSFLLGEETLRAPPPLRP
jgi:hypothetical protein